MKKIIIIIGVCSFIIGCAWTKQAVQDYQTGKNTPISNSEISPSQQAQNLAAPISSIPIPYAMPIAMAVTFLGTIFFTWKRGVTLRKTGAAPVTTSTSVTLFGSIEQFLANTFAGAFTTIQNSGGLTGTVLQRVWKVALATLASGTTVAVANPQVGSFLTGHPVLDTLFVALSSGIAGLEKALSNVPVVTPTNTGTSATTTTVTLNPPASAG